MRKTKIYSSPDGRCDNLFADFENLMNIQDSISKEGKVESHNDEDSTKQINIFNNDFLLL